MASYSKVLLKSLNHGIPISHLPLFSTNCVSWYKNSSHYLQRRIKNRHCISTATRSVLEISVLCCKICDQYFHLHTRKKERFWCAKGRCRKMRRWLKFVDKCEECSNKRPKMESFLCCLFIFILLKNIIKSWTLKNIIKQKLVTGKWAWRQTGSSARLSAV